MNRIELEALVSERAKLNRHHANDAVTAVLDLIEEALHRGDSVRLTGFATIEVKDQPARQGTNPKTGEPIVIPARRKVVMRPGKRLRDLVNAG